MRIAVLGTTGAVGRTMLDILDERGFPASELVLLASERSAGKRLRWRGREWPVCVPAPGVFDGCAIALFSAGATRSREWAPQAAEEGATVIDNSSAWRMDDDVPLVVPEVNATAIVPRSRGIIANPNCAVIQLVVALAAIRRTAALRRVVATTFQSASGAGEKGTRALTAELAGDHAPDSPFPTQLAGNLVPWIGPRTESGWNEEEIKVRDEARKILGEPELAVAATCVRVPVAVGHSVSATVELERPVTRDELHAGIDGMPGLVLHGDDADPTPRDVAGTDVVRIGRLRIDPDIPSVLHCWVVADNLRKGAATNAVQIAEEVCRG